MAISLAVEVIETALWPQGDIRDPLGIWGARLGVTGDASGGEIKVVAQISAEKSAAYVYTCYSAVVVLLTGALVVDQIGFRLLTNWPDIDPLAGVQGYASGRGTPVIGIGSTAPVAVPEASLVSPQDRFILLFDPRAGRNATMDIAELKDFTNTDLSTMSFEFYGYFWDRSVLNAPGGPRHPGAS